MAAGGTAEAERWLVLAEKLLASRDLQGSRTFAIRARESDPRLERSDRILAVVDTLLAGNSRINNNQQDWYAVLQLVPQTQDSRVISSQYSRLAYLLSPATNTLPFADLAFRLIFDAFAVLSNPSKKWLYDNELNLVSESTHDSHPSFSAPQPYPPSQLPPQQPEPEPEPEPMPEPEPQLQSRHMGMNPRAAKSSEKPVEESNEPKVPSFWTACPYCFYLFEYPKVYQECSLRCQNCRRAFHAVLVPPPPVTESGKDSYFCCWEFFPLGFSLPNSKSTKKANGISNWAPFSAMFACPSPANERPNAVERTPYAHVSEVNRSVPKPPIAKAASRRGARVLMDEEDEPFVEVSSRSEDSDDDWNNSNSNRKKKKAKNLKGRGSGSKSVKGRKGGQGVAGEVKGSVGEISGAGYVLQEGVGVVNAAKSDVGKKGSASNSKRQTGKAAKDLGKLDLNVEFSNEVEEPPAAISGHGARNGEEDGMEGIGFFEGLDEFLSSLPILSVVGDEKVKAAD